MDCLFNLYHFKKTKEGLRMIEAFNVIIDDNEEAFKKLTVELEGELVHQFYDDGHLMNATIEVENGFINCINRSNVGTEVINVTEILEEKQEE